MVRVGVEEHLAEELLADFPREAEIVRVPNQPIKTLDVDFWIPPFRRDQAEAVFPHLRGVKVVQSMMAGVDWLLPWLPKDVVLCDGRGIHDVSTSEWVVTAILSALKRFPLYRDLQRQQQWRGDAVAADPFLPAAGAHARQYQLLAEDLDDKTVLIVGYGSIGAAIEARLTPFGARFLRIARTARGLPHGRPDKFVHSITDLHRLLPQADVVVLILPLTAETKGLIGSVELGLMQRGALLVNAARGPVVQTDALLAALQQNALRAVLDVTDPEPLPAGHPLWSAPNCMITPHIGGSTPQFIHRAFRFGAKQVRRLLAGEALENRVTQAGY
jgi:phosphoglycerate dehydrogenase-like enzyme